jgi:hypothetical protein
MKGGELVLEMGQAAGAVWGRGEEDLPPSSITDHPVLPAPYLEPAPYSFTGSLEVSMGCADPEAEIRYTTDGSEPGRKSNRYERPLKINQPAEIRTVALKKDSEPSPVVDTRFSRIPEDISLELLSEYSSMYTAGGDLALIDRVRGGDNFRTGMWQGYRGTDIVAVVDLGKTRKVKSVTAGFLQETGSWIFMPEIVVFEISKNGEDYETVAELAHAIPQDLEGSVTKDFTRSGINRRARYVRMTAVNAGLLPDWHPGAGHTSWLFADEIVVEF